MQEIEKDNNVIHDFNSLPQSSLQTLAQNLGLRTSRAELAFCAKHYKAGSSTEISVQTLRMLDALACPAHVSPSKIAIGEMLTDHEEIAEAYRDAIAKLKVLGKPSDQPITLFDLCDLPARYFQRLSGKETSAPETTQAQYADALVLLCPDAQATEANFDSSAAVLLADEEISPLLHFQKQLDRTSILHTVLKASRGAVINLARLPLYLQTQEALATPTHGILLAIAQKDLPLLQQKAQERQLACNYFGVVDQAEKIIIKNGTESLTELGVNYLNAICFVRSYALRLHRGELTKGKDPFAQAMHCAARAYCNAVATGCDPANIVLHARIDAVDRKPRSRFYGDALCALLGLYRFCMETSVQLHTDLTFDAEILSLVVSAEPAEQKLPDMLQGKGYVYLLCPRGDQSDLPDCQELAGMAAYLHKHISEGHIRSVHPVCDQTPEEVLCEMTDGTVEIIRNPDYTLELSQTSPVAVIVESQIALKGDLIAFCGATDGRIS